MLILYKYTIYTTVSYLEKYRLYVVQLYSIISFFIQLCIYSCYIMCSYYTNIQFIYMYMCMFMYMLVS